MSEPEVPGRQNRDIAPGFPRRASSRVDELAARFKKSVRDIAVALAYHESSDSVSVRHVDEAYTTLARAGLSRLRWFQRTEFEATGGGLLIALSGMFTQIASIFMDAGTKREVVTNAGILVSLVLGIAIIIHSFYRSNFPIPRDGGGRLKALLQNAALILILAGIGYIVWRLAKM